MVILTYLLTPWCRVLLEKLTGLQLVKKFPTFYGTRRFITAFTSFRHPSLSWASPIRSTCPQPTSWRSILILPTHLRLGLPSGLFPSGFPTRTLYAYRYSSTLSLTSALDRVSGQRHAPAALSPGKKPGTHFIVGWVGSIAGRDGCGKFCPSRDFTRQADELLVQWCVRLDSINRLLISIEF